jgi:hypothetical protein
MKQLALALLGTALIAGPALAQTQQPAASQRADRGDRMLILKEGQWRGSKVTGLTVYNNNNERIGDINELIIGRDGKIDSVVIGVGGFLGMGEHDVAVPFGQVKFVDEPVRSTARTTDARPADNRPATTADNRSVTRAPEGTGTTTAPPDRVYRGHPDHAVVNMSKDQLKTMPEVRYSR